MNNILSYLRSHLFPSNCNSLISIFDISIYYLCIVYDIYIRSFSFRLFTIYTVTKTYKEFEFSVRHFSRGFFVHICNLHVYAPSNALEWRRLVNLFLYLMCCIWKITWNNSKKFSWLPWILFFDKYMGGEAGANFWGFVIGVVYHTR